VSAWALSIIGSGEQVGLCTPLRQFDGEREVVKRILKMRSKGWSVHAIAKALNEDGVRTRYGKQFKTQTVQNILARADLTVPAETRPKAQ
jgi:Recombinase